MSSEEAKQKQNDWYEHVYDEFLLYYGNVYKDVTHYYPSGLVSIVVVLRDGTRVEYNSHGNSICILDEWNDDSLDEEDFRKHFARALNRRMEAACYNSVGLSEVTGISQNMISKYSRGVSIPNIFNIRRIAKALGCSASELIYFSK